MKKTFSSLIVGVSLLLSLGVPAHADPDPSQPETSPSPSQSLIFGGLQSIQPSELPTPDPIEPKILDDAGVFTEKEHDELLETLTDIMNDNDIVFAVQTSAKGDKDVTSEVTQSARSLKLGDPDKQNGVLIYIDTASKDAQIVVGTGIQDKVSTISIANTLNTSLLPKIRSNEILTGVYDTVGNISTAYATDQNHSSEPVVPSQVTYASTVLKVTIIVAVTLFLLLIARLAGKRIYSSVKKKKTDKYYAVLATNTEDFWNNLDDADKNRILDLYHSSTSYENLVDCISEFIHEKQAITQVDYLCLGQLVQTYSETRKDKDTASQGKTQPVSQQDGVLHIF